MQSIRLQQLQRSLCLEHVVNLLHSKWHLRNTTKQYPPEVIKGINAAGWATLHEPLAPGEALTARQFARCARFADECRARGGVVVVHCTNGVHRTGAFCVR